MSFYIAIEGVIGVGKTSLARYLQPLFASTLCIEEFEENPFLAKFYQDRARYAFQTQVFFLLSRYDQQQQLLKANRPIVSDYIFAKDYLFAQQNLSGDELATYQRVYEALAMSIPQPDLIVYLRAETPKLMAQIARRDRPYERNMDRAYIDELRLAYERFFAEYNATPLLTIDTTGLDFVQNEADRNYIVDRIRGALGVGPHQAQLPGLNAAQNSIAASNPPPPPDDPLQIEASARRLGDFQRFHQEFDRVKGFDTDLFLNFALLQEEIGELAKALVTLARHSSTSNTTDLLAAVGDEFADVLAYTLKIANYVGVDLEAAYLEKMKLNQGRTWKND